MAKREKVEGFGTVITLDPHEALELVTLLTSHMAGVPAKGRMAGACPEIKIVKFGQVEERISFSVNMRKKEG